MGVVNKMVKAYETFSCSALYQHGNFLYYIQDWVCKYVHFTTGRNCTKIMEIITAFLQKCFEIHIHIMKQKTPRHLNDSMMIERKFDGLLPAFKK